MLRFPKTRGKPSRSKAAISRTARDWQADPKHAFRTGHRLLPHEKGSSRGFALWSVQWLVFPWQ